MPPHWSRSIGQRQGKMLPSNSRKRDAPKNTERLERIDRSDNGEEVSSSADYSSDEEQSQSAKIAEAHLHSKNYDIDVDAPRVAQWINEEEVELAAQESENEDEEEVVIEEVLGGPSNIESLQSDLSSLPLGALRKAQYALKHADAASDSENESDESEDYGDVPESTSLKGKEKAKQEWSIKPRTDIIKRPNKHAPTEVTSKRPVTRNRTVVEVKPLQIRDPRFLSMTGQFSAQKYQQQYGFLADVHQTELKTLRENLKRARKLLASSPRHMHAEYEREVNRLELAVKRAESIVNRDKRVKVEEEALSRVAKEERDKRKTGKGGWWLKESDKKELLVRARYDVLAASGGKRAVKKAIEKKQKKVAQKEKKSRPFAPGAMTHEKRPKRSLEGSRSDTGSSKRRRTE